MMFVLLIFALPILSGIIASSINIVLSGKFSYVDMVLVTFILVLLHLLMVNVIPTSGHEGLFDVEFSDPRFFVGLKNVLPIFGIADLLLIVCVCIFRWAQHKDDRK